jgi:hypothetical protein
MTLILSFLTPEYVLQASDRRFVRENAAGDVIYCDDERNKAIFWRGRVAYAFAGLADLGDKGRTDLWLGRQLFEARNSPNMNAVLTRLAGACDREFARERNAKLSPAARVQDFVCVGWATVDGKEPFRPYLAQISNHHGAAVPLARAPGTFNVRRKVLNESEMVLHQAGTSLGHEETRAFYERLGALAHSQPGPDLVAIALLEKIREVASRCDAVGSGVMLNIIPRGAIGRTGRSLMVTGGAPPVAHASFHYFPSGSAEPYRGYGPLAVTDAAILDGFEFGPATGRFRQSTEEADDSS